MKLHVELLKYVEVLSEVSLPVALRNLMAWQETAWRVSAMALMVLVAAYCPGPMAAPLQLPGDCCSQVGVLLHLSGKLCSLVEQGSATACVAGRAEPNPASVCPHDDSGFPRAGPCVAAFLVNLLACSSKGCSYVWF